MADADNFYTINKRLVTFDVMVNSRLIQAAPIYIGAAFLYWCQAFNNSIKRKNVEITVFCIFAFNLVE